MTLSLFPSLLPPWLHVQCHPARCSRWASWCSAPVSRDLPEQLFYASVTCSCWWSRCQSPASPPSLCECQQSEKGNRERESNKQKILVLLVTYVKPTNFSWRMLALQKNSRFIPFASRFNTMHWHNLSLNSPLKIQFNTCADSLTWTGFHPY